jgi:hypothetical protein
MGSIIGTIAQIRHEHYQRVVAGEPVETDEDSAVREWWNSTGRYGAPPEWDVIFDVTVCSVPGLLPRVKE